MRLDVRPKCELMRASIVRHPRDIALHPLEIDQRRRRFERRERRAVRDVRLEDAAHRRNKYDAFTNSASLRRSVFRKLNASGSASCAP